MGGWGRGGDWSKFLKDMSIAVQWKSDKKAIFISIMSKKKILQIYTRRNNSVCLLHACLFSSIKKIKRKQWTHEDDDWRRQWLSDCAAVVIEWLEPLENPPRITTMSCATKNLASLAKAGPTIRRVSSTIQIFTYMYHMLVVCSIEMFLTLVKYLREPREFKC